jgi:hypothetical protein
MATLGYEILNAAENSGDGIGAPRKTLSEMKASRSSGTDTPRGDYEMRTKNISKIVSK